MVLNIDFQYFHRSGDDFVGKDGIRWSWHHHQDGKTMQLIPRDINTNAKHIGGATIIQKLGKGFFNPPALTIKTACQ